MKKIIIRISALICIVIVGICILRPYLRQTAAQARAPAACLFIGQAAREWHDAYKEHKIKLPAAYPQSLDQLIIYNFIPHPMMDDFFKLMHIKIFPPTSEPPPDYIFVKTYIKGSVFGGSIGGYTRKISNTAEQDAAANP